MVKRRIQGGLGVRGYQPKWSANEFKVINTSGNVVVVEEGGHHKAYKVNDLQVIHAPLVPGPLALGNDEPSTELEKATKKAQATARFAKEGIETIKEFDPTIYNGLKIVQEFDIEGQKRRKTFYGVVTFDPIGGSRAKPFRIDYSDGQKAWYAEDMIKKLLTTDSKNKLKKKAR
jgi:hypothetical protein